LKRLRLGRRGRLPLRVSGRVEADFGLRRDFSRADCNVLIQNTGPLAAKRSCETQLLVPATFRTPLAAPRWCGRTVLPVKGLLAPGLLSGPASETSGRRVSRFSSYHFPMVRFRWRATSEWLYVRPPRWMQLTCRFVASGTAAWSWNHPKGHGNLPGPAVLVRTPTGLRGSKILLPSTGGPAAVHRKSCFFKDLRYLRPCIYLYIRCTLPELGVSRQGVDQRDPPAGRITQKQFS